MIIKLHLPIIFYARHKVVKVVSPLTLKERVRTDRLVMVLLYVMVIIGAVLFT